MLPIIFMAASILLTVESQETPSEGAKVEVQMVSFKKGAECQDWVLVNDDVMGGVSKSQLACDGEKGVFSGRLSMLNNGGFASVRKLPRSYSIAGMQGLRVRVKGDGRIYQIRLRTSNRFDGVSWMAEIAPPAGQWTDLELPFEEFKPVFRGRAIRGLEPLDPKDIRQVGVLIADKNTDPFSIELKSIWAFGHGEGK